MSVFSELRAILLDGSVESLAHKMVCSRRPRGNEMPTADSLSLLLLPTSLSLCFIVLPLMLVCTVRVALGGRVARMRLCDFG